MALSKVYTALSATEHP